jgi:cell division protein FtsB
MAFYERALRNLPKISLFMAVNVVVLGFLFVGFGREYWRNLEIERDIAALQAEGQRLEGERLQSLSLISDLSSEYYLESEARTKRGLGEPGEQLIIVDLPEDTLPEGEVLGLATDDGLSNPTRWWYYFFNRARFATMREL